MISAPHACRGRVLKNAVPWLSCVLSLVILATGCGGSSSPTVPTPTPSPTPAPAPTASTWVAEGTRLTNAVVGFSGVLADTSSILLANGSWRMFYYAGGQYRSAVSTDGLAFTIEAGARLPVGDGQSRALKLDDGRVRIYFISSGGISSAISSDEGLTFTPESGARVTAGAAGLSALSGPGLARKNGQWRMYFSDLPLPGTVTAHKVLSATSSDLLSWTMDAGVRIGAGATLTGSAEHPSAIANSDGSISIFYFRNSGGLSGGGLLTATSTDGLTFTTEIATGIAQGNDPDVVSLGGGSLRMYYNWGDDSSGTIYSARGTAASSVSQFGRSTSGPGLVPIVPTVPLFPIAPGAPSPGFGVGRPMPAGPAKGPDRSGSGGVIKTPDTFPR